MLISFVSLCGGPVFHETRALLRKKKKKKKKKKIELANKTLLNSGIEPLTVGDRGAFVGIIEV